MEGKYFFDDGTEYNADLFPKPNLCLICKKEMNPNEEMLCNLNRMDQIECSEFQCFAFEKKN